MDRKRMNTITALPQTTEAQVGETRLSIEGLILLLWSRKLLFASVTLLFASLIIAWAFLATPIYRVEAKVMPRHNGPEGGGLQELLSQFGGLAGMAGLNVGLSGHVQENIALLRSRTLFETFARRENLMPVLFSKDWDPVTKHWRSTLKHVPTMQDAWERFDRGIRTVDQDEKTQVVTVQIRWKNRYQAADWANEIVRLANEDVRQRAIDEAEASLQSLQQQLKATSAVELRESIYRLMEVQINREVIAKSRPDYAFVVLDPAAVPDADKFASPRRGLLLFVALPFGVVIGSLVVVGLQMINDFIRKVRRLIAASR